MSSVRSIDGDLDVIRLYVLPGSQSRKRDWDVKDDVLAITGADRDAVVIRFR
jgi:hypothetical protein